MPFNLIEPFQSENFVAVVRVREHFFDHELLSRY
jgi:hypothetical protein